MSSGEHLPIALNDLAPFAPSDLWVEDSLLRQTLTSDHTPTKFVASTTVTFTEWYSCWPQDCKE